MCKYKFICLPTFCFVFFFFSASFLIHAEFNLSPELSVLSFDTVHCFLLLDRKIFTTQIMRQPVQRAIPFLSFTIPKGK